jgi:hypothetical protein
MMLRLVPALALLTACYEPSPVEGLPCSPSGGCPDGQRCSGDKLCRIAGGDDCQLDEQVARLEQRVVPDDPQASAGFGGRIATTERWLVIGVENDDALGTDAGATYVFEKIDGSYRRSAKLAMGAARDHFGAAVAVAGDRVVVGAPGAGGDVGRAYVFEYDSTWSLVATLSPADGVSGDAFGDAVAVSAVGVAIGAPGRTGGEGVVFLYESSDRFVAATALVPDTATRGFAAALAMNEGLLAIGVPGDPAGADLAAAGAVQVLRRQGDGWLPAGSIVAPERAENAQYGAAVALDGARLVIGAPGDSGERGTAFVAEVNAGGPVARATLVAASASARDNFGAAVAVAGDLVLIGAPNHDAAGMNAGGGFLFRGGGAEFREQLVLRDPTPDAFDQLGGAVALTSTGPLLASPLDDADALMNVGAVLSFTLECP